MIKSPRPVWLSATIAVMVLVLGAVDFTSELGTDYGGYFSHGWFITKGLIPYRDFWTHKTPLLPLILAGWITVFGAGFHLAALFPLIVVLTTGIVAYWFARTLEYGRAVATGAALLFAFFGGSHLIDPSRNGVIIIAAAGFEMLAVIAAIKSARTRHRGYAAASGVMIALAFATRQTAAAVCLPVVLAFVLFRGRDQIRRTAEDVVLIALTCGLAIGAMAYGFIANHVPLSTMLDQTYRFNLEYAAGYRIKFTWWVSEWGQVLWANGLAVFALCTLWFLSRLVESVRRGVVVAGDVVLISLLVAHSAAIYASHKVQVMYLGQVLPELCVMAALAGTRAWVGVTEPAVTPAWRWGTIGATLLLLAWPIYREVELASAAVTRARSGGYLFNVDAMPSQLLARRIQTLTREGDRIWVFAANADALYPYANRLPAGRMTSVAGLVYPSANGFDDWRRDFEGHRPRVVIGFYGGEFFQRYSTNPDASNGQSMATIVEIQRYLSRTMRRMVAIDQRPEVFVWSFKETGGGTPDGQ